MEPYDQISELSADEAQDVLQDFLQLERENFPRFKFGEVELDFSPASVIEALYFVVCTELKSKVIKNEEIHFLCMRLGYYFGESLCKMSKKLSWGIGEQGSSFEKHPVVRGFGSGDEAAVITICRNVVLAVAVDGAPTSRIDGAIKHWFDMAAA